MPGENGEQRTNVHWRAISRPFFVDFVLLAAALGVSYVVFTLTSGHTLFESLTPVVWESARVGKAGADDWIEGAVPLWNAYAFGGFPFHASGIAGIFYPPSLLYTLEDQKIALSIDLALHALVCAVGAYWLVRDLCKSRVAALVAGVAAVGTVPASHLLVDQPITTLHAFALLPWILLCCRRAMESGRPLWGLLAALVLAAQVFTGAIQFTVISMFVAAEFIVFDALRRYLGDWQPLASVARRTAIPLIALVLGIGLAAAQAVPSLELFADGGHGAAASAESDELTYAHHIAAPAPIVFDTETEVPALQIGGLFLCLLAIFGWVRSPAREKWAFLGVVLVAYLFLSGSMNWLYAPLFARPFFEPDTAFTQIASMMGLIVVLMAGAGAAVVMQKWESARARLRQVWPLGVMLVGAAAWTFWSADDSIVGLAWMTPALVVLGLGAALTPRHQELIGGIWLVACLLFDMSSGVLASTTEVAPSQEIRLYGPGGRFDQIAEEYKDYGRMALLREEKDTERDPSLEGLRNDERTLPVYSRADEAFLGANWSDATAHFPFLWYLNDEELKAHPADADRVRAGVDVLCALNVEYIVTPRPGPVLMNLICEAGDTVLAKFEFPEGVIYKNVGAAPVAYILHDAKVRGPGQNLAGRIADTAFDWRKTVLVESPIEAARLGHASESEGIRVETYTRNEVELELFVDSPGVLVLTDSFYPGWKATFDNANSRKVFRVNGFMRGVAVEPDDNHVVFSYEPASFDTGWKLSLGAAITWVLLAAIFSAAWVARRRRVEAVQV